MRCEVRCEPRIRIQRQASNHHPPGSSLTHLPELARQIVADVTSIIDPISMPSTSDIEYSSL